jgi:precorrin-6A/cobalt-precorrin-6A reductase
MILLLGGTSETASIATALAEAGMDVLVSTATDEALDVGSHPGIRRRAGRLDVPAMLELVGLEKVAAIVDATHPYAAAAHAVAAEVAERAGIARLRFERPGSIEPADDIHFAADHVGAAALAFSFGLPVLLTTGANNLAPYVRQSRRSGVRIVARVLARGESVEACRREGIEDRFVIAARGPFSVEENLRHLRQFDIGTIVTKDSGQSGGTAEKLHAARLQKCNIVVVARPAGQVGPVATTIPQLLARLDDYR